MIPKLGVGRQWAKNKAFCFAHFQAQLAQSNGYLNVAGHRMTLCPSNTCHVIKAPNLGTCLWMFGGAYSEGENLYLPHQPPLLVAHAEAGTQSKPRKEWG